MLNLSRFQIILLSAFSFFIVIGVLIFATFQTKNNASYPTVVMWGVFDDSAMNDILSMQTFQDQKLQIQYVEKSEKNIESELVEAIAEGKGPDLILIPQSLLLSEKNKLTLIPYDALSAREFKNTYLESAEVMLDQNGFWGLPFSIDPLVLYWNRTEFTDASISTPPQYWDQLTDMVSKLTVRDSGGNLRRGAIALGTFANIDHAKDIISALFLQVGNQIVDVDSSGVLRSKLKDSDSRVGEALNFYTSFSDPVKANYTWSRAFQSSHDSFTRGDISMYIGFASEISNIRSTNPNLNFDVTTLPQIKGQNKATFGKMSVLAIPKQSQNKDASFLVAKTLSGPDVGKLLVEKSLLPPVRRDLLGLLPKDAYKAVFYNSALFSRVWQDPSSKETDTIFRDMIDSINSGSANVNESLGEASNEMDNLLRRSDN